MHTKFVCGHIMNTHLDVVTITNLAMLGNLEVIPDKYNAVGICAGGNYAQEWTTKLCNY